MVTGRGLVCQRPDKEENACVSRRLPSVRRTVPSPGRCRISHTTASRGAAPIGQTAAAHLDPVPSPQGRGPFGFRSGHLPSSVAPPQRNEDLCRLLHTQTNSRLRARRAAAAQEVDDGTTPEQRGEQDKAVQAFMAYITTPKPRRSVPQLRATVDRLRAKLAADNGPAGVTRLRVVAERLNAEEELEAAERVALDPEMVAKLEGDFAAVAKPWATRNAIPVGAFRELGVHPRVLKAAGLH